MTGQSRGRFGEENDTIREIGEDITKHNNSTPNNGVRYDAKFKICSVSLAPTGSRLTKRSETQRYVKSKRGEYNNNM